MRTLIVIALPIALAVVALAVGWKWARTLCVVMLVLGSLAVAANQRHSTLRRFDGSNIPPADKTAYLAGYTEAVDFGAAYTPFYGGAVVAMALLALDRRKPTK